MESFTDPKEKVSLGQEFSFTSSSIHALHIQTFNCFNQNGIFLVPGYSKIRNSSIQVSFINVTKIEMLISMGLLSLLMTTIPSLINKI